MKRTSKISALGGLVLLTAVSRDALALNWTPHQWTVRATVAAMYDVGHGQEWGPYQPPPGVSAEEYQVFLDEVARSYDTLLTLQTGLPEPVLSTYGSDLSECGYDQSHDLEFPRYIPIGDFRYTVPRGYDQNCSMQRVSCEDRYLSLGQVLGWHAATVDWELGDTHLWLRPTSASYWGVMKEGLNWAWQIAAGIVVSAYCLFGGCDGFELARKYNPIEYAEGWIPGIGDIQDESYVGMWHFIDSQALIARYNDPPGLDYEFGGPDGIPGAVDILIMIGADATGLSLNAHTSEGVNRYGQFDDEERSWPQWQAHTIAHTEFSSVDNLAKYGWEKFLDEPTNARYLGWPLHALGDTAMPQHLASTTGWGHPEYEGAQDDELSFVSAIEFSVNPEKDGYNRFKQGSQIPSSILRAAYPKWAEYRSSGEFRLRALVTEIGEANRGDVPDDVYQDYGIALTEGTKNSREEAYRTRDYGSGRTFADANRSLYVRTMAGMLDVLVAAANATAAQPHTFKCPVGSHYSGNWPPDCVPGEPDPATVFEPCSASGSVGTPCLVDGDCVTGKCAGLCVVPGGLSEPFAPGTICSHWAEPMLPTGSACSSGVCGLDSRCTGGTVSDDGSCLYDLDCVSGNCDNGICRPPSGPAGNGEPCDEHSDCESGFCSANGICADRLPEGTGPCTSDAECATGYCNSQGLCASTGKGLNEECTDSAECAGLLWCVGGLCMYPVE